MAGKPGAFRDQVLRVLPVLILLGLWEYFGRRVNPVLSSFPTAVVRALWELLLDGELLAALGQSIQPFLYGLLLAVVAGITLGVLIGRVQLLDTIFGPLINAIYVVPPVALIPIIMMWFGLGLTAKTFIVFLVAVFPILYNSMDGTRSISRQHVDVARAYGAGEWQIFVDVTIHAALPFIMSGFRQGAGRALIGLIVAELFTSLSGLGALLAVFTNTLETAKVFAVVFVLGLLGMVLLASGAWLERKVAPWKQSERAW